MFSLSPWYKASLQQFEDVSMAFTVCSLCPQQCAYGDMLTGYLAAVKNLHILDAVCSTSSNPVLGACEFVSISR